MCTAMATSAVITSYSTTHEPALVRADQVCVGWTGFWTCDSNCGDVPRLIATGDVDEYVVHLPLSCGVQHE